MIPLSRFFKLCHYYILSKYNPSSKSDREERETRIKSNKPCVYSCLNRGDLMSAEELAVVSVGWKFFVSSITWSKITSIPSHVSLPIGISQCGFTWKANHAERTSAWWANERSATHSSCLGAARAHTRTSSACSSLSNPSLRQSPFPTCPLRFPLDTWSLGTRTLFRQLCSRVLPENWKLQTVETFTNWGSFSKFEDLD